MSLAWPSWVSFGWESFLLLCLAAFLAGLVRGFSGFGAALVFTPLANIVVEPWRAVTLLVILDFLLALPLLPRAAKACVWREVAPLTGAAALTVPVGAFFLVSVDATALRWAMALLALLAVGVLVSGWRYASRPTPYLSAGVGALAGGLGGLSSFYGPPIIIFWLSGQAGSGTVRANLIVFFAAIGLVASTVYTLLGILTVSVFLESLLLMPPYGVSLFLGARLFGLASERTFRNLAYLAIVGAALSSLPVWQW